MRTAEQFWAYVKKTDGCWEWIGARTVEGYGNLLWRGSYSKAHRVALALDGRPLPPGMCALHKCDNPPCVRPDHLYVGTKQQNAIDRETRGRGVHLRGDAHPARRDKGSRAGTRNGRSKLNEAKVREIRERRKAGESAKVLGSEYGVSTTVIYHIEQRKLWAEVGDT